MPTSRPCSFLQQNIDALLSKAREGKKVVDSGRAEADKILALAADSGVDLDNPPIANINETETPADLLGKTVDTAKAIVPEMSGPPATGAELVGLLTNSNTQDSTKKQIISTLRKDAGFGDVVPIKTEVAVPAAAALLTQIPDNDPRMQTALTAMNALPMLKKVDTDTDLLDYLSLDGIGDDLLGALQGVFSAEFPTLEFPDLAGGVQDIGKSLTNIVKNPGKLSLSRLSEIQINCPDLDVSEIMDMLGLVGDTDITESPNGNSASTYSALAGLADMINGLFERLNISGIVSMLDRIADCIDQTCSDVDVENLRREINQIKTDVPMDENGVPIITPPNVHQNMVQLDAVKKQNAQQTFQSTGLA